MQPLPETVHWRTPADTCWWCETGWPCPEAEAEELQGQRAEQPCARCGHPRHQHVADAVGAPCVAVDVTADDQLRDCRCRLYRPA